MTTLRRLQTTSMEGPTMVWHRTLPGDQYWEWTSRERHMVLTIAVARPLEPWIEFYGRALFKYPARCLTHECLGHPNMRPLYMALHTPNALPLELDPALGTHLQGHFGGTITLHRHKDPTESPKCMRPRTEPSTWFQDLPPLATISGAIVATDAETTEGMVMALVYETAPGDYHTWVASGDLLGGGGCSCASAS